MFPQEGHPFSLLSGTVPSHTGIWTSNVLCLPDSSNCPLLPRTLNQSFPLGYKTSSTACHQGYYAFSRYETKDNGKKLKYSPSLDHKLLLAYLSCGMLDSLCCLEKKPVA